MGRSVWPKAIVILGTILSTPILAEDSTQPEVPFVFDDVTGFDSPTDTAKIEAALKADEPRRAAAAAIARGDFRLILVSTVGPSYIGFDCIISPLRSFARVQIPVSDVVTEGLGEFAKAFFEYANIYNKAILNSPAYPDYDICHVGEPRGISHRGRYSDIRFEDLQKGGGEGRAAEYKDISHAVRFGHLDAVRKFIASKIDLNRPDMFGMTPLVWAIVRGYEDITAELLTAGADPNRFALSDETLAPLAWTALTGRTSIAQLLLMHGAAVDGNDAGRRGTAPLAIASERSDMSLVELLLTRGANVNASGSDNRTPLSMAARAGNLALVQRFLAAGADPNLSPGDGDWHADPPPLHAAIATGKLSLVEALLGAKADPNRTNHCGGDSAIQFAAEKQDVSALTLLLQHGGDVNAGQDKRRFHRYSSVSSRCDEPIYVAFDQSVSQPRMDPRILQLLLNAGADLNERNSYNEESVLHKAAENGDETSVATLLLNHADANFRDEDGRTPLFSAVGANRNDLPTHANTAVSIAKRLIMAGGDPNLLDENNETPLFMYGACGGKIADFLIAQGVSALQINNDGQTALWEAVRAACPELGVALVKAGVDPDHIDRDGNTAFTAQDPENSDPERANRVRAAIAELIPKPAKP